MKQRTLGQICQDGRRVALAPDASVREAVEVMRNQVIGAVMVMQDGALHGIFSERDLVTRVVALGLDASATRLEEVMTREVVTAATDTGALVALRMMRERGFRHLPVADGNTVVGLVSLRDFLGDEAAEVNEEMSFENAVAEELW